MVARIEPTDRPIEWIRQTEFSRIGEPGCLFVSAPANAGEAWNRRLIGANSVGFTDHVGALRGLIEGRVRLGRWKQRLMEDPTQIMQVYVAGVHSLA